MAQLWVLQDSWAVVPLGADPLVVTGDPATPVRYARGVAAGEPAVLLRPVPGSRGDWALLCEPGACLVNGEPAALGIRVLRDRDEIQPARGVRCYFSTESLAAVAPFQPAGSAESVLCPRCLLPIAAGAPAVVCPSCGVAYHEDTANELPCWTYGPCTMCGREGTLEADYLWSPEGL